MTRRPQAQRGMTLIEMQVALVIVALITLVLTGALRLAGNSWQRLGARQDNGEQWFQTAAMLRRHLSQARAVDIGVVSEGIVDGLFGGVDYLHYVAPFPGYNHDGELYWWTLRALADWESGQGLVLEYRPFNAGGMVEQANAEGLILRNDSEAPTRIALSPALAGLRLSYFQSQDHPNPDWQDQQPPGEAFPQLLRLELFGSEELADERGQEVSQWPDIVVAPRLQVRVAGSSSVAPTPDDEI